MMDKPTRLRSPNVKRKSKIQPVSQRVTLERVLGLTLSSNTGLTCDNNTGTIAYPAGCVVVLFNPKRKKQSHLFNCCKKTITALSFSKDGKHLVTGEAGHLPAVRVWDVEEKSQVAEFHGHNFRVNCVAFFPNSKYIVSIGSQHDKMVNVWNWKTGNKVASNKISSKVSAVDFNEDGSNFVTVGHRHVKFWYLDSSKSKINAPRPLSGRNGILGEQKNNYFCDVACGRDRQANNTYCITQSGLLCQFNEKRLLDKWAELRTRSANCISVGEDFIFVGCSEGTVRIFSSESLFFISTLPCPHFLGVDISSAITPSHVVHPKTDAKYPDTMAIVYDDFSQKVTCVYNDHSLYVWDVHDIKKVGKVWSFLYHSACIWGLDVYPSLDNNNNAILPPGSFLTSSGDDTVRVWNIESQLQDNTVYKRNIYSNELLKIIYADPSHNFLCDVEYNLAGSTDKTDTNYDSKNGIRSIRVSPDGKHLATGDREGNIKIYDMHFMDDVRSIEAHDGDVLCLEYHYIKGGPRLLATASRDRLIHVFDVDENYGLLQTLDDHSSCITAVKFASNGEQLKMLSCGADKSILFRNATMSPELQFNVDQHLASKATLYDMIIDPSHKFVATACQDRNVRIYSIAKAKQKKNYKGTQADDGVLLRLQLDPSGSYVATSCTDKSICIVDFYTGEVVATMYGHSEVVTGIQFTNDLKHIISVSSDGCIFIWKLPIDMTKQMKSRMELLGKIPKETKIYDDLNKKNTTLSETIDLNIEDTIPTLDSDYKSPGKVLDILQDKPQQDSPNLDYRFSVGELPNWAKNKMSDAQSEASDSSNEGQLPRGRWAQRADKNPTEVFSQLEKSIETSSLDDRRKFSYEAEALQQQIADLRRETMILNQQTNTQNIPIIDDDDVTNIDDEEEFFPSGYINNRDSVDSDRTSWDSTDVKSPPYSTQSLGRRLGAAGRKWGSRTSLNFEKSYFEFDDLDDDFRTDTPEVIYYPENDLESVKSYESSFSVYANKTNKLTRRYGTLDDDSESTDPVSLDDMEEEDDSTGLSNPSTPSDPDKGLLSTTPDKDKFVKENFENVAFTPIAPEKFHKALDHIEEELNSNVIRPFSPRLSISARFLSRAQQAGLKSTFNSLQKSENWLDKSKSDMARAVDETRRRLLAMGWDGDNNNIDNDDNKPPSPPTKLESNVSSFKIEDERTSPKSILNSEKVYEDDEDDDLSTTSSTSSLRLRSSQPNLRSLKTEDKRRSTPNLRSSLDSALSQSPEGKRGSAGQSYLKPTKSSNAKILRSSSTSTLPSVKTEPSQTSSLTKATSLTSLNVTKSEQPSTQYQKKRPSQVKKGSRLSSSKLAQYASTPNLACVEEDDEEEPQTNLLNLSNLTKSVPDINDLDDDSTSSSTENPPKPLTNVSRRTGLRTRFTGFKKERDSSVDSGGASIDKRLPRRSLNVGSAISAECQGVRRSLSPLMNHDSGLMPPPLNISRKKPDSILKHSIKRRSQPELSLDEAKDILMGRSKSGRDFFSKDKENKVSADTNTPEKLEQSDNSKSGKTPPQTSVPSSHRTLPQVGGHKTSSPPFNSASTKQVQPNSNNQTHKTPPHSTTPLVTSQASDMDEKQPSIKDRIKLYYSHMTPDKEAHEPREPRSRSASQSDIKYSPHSGISAMLDLNISSLSQSDTGVGSDTDTDSEIKRPDKTTSHPRLSLVTNNHDIDNGVSLTTPSLDQLRLDPIKINRSKLSLPITPDYNSQDFFTNCSEAVADLKNAIQRLKQIHIQSCNIKDGNSEQVQALLGQAFQEAHHTFADLSAKTPTDSTEKTLSFPNVPETSTKHCETSSEDDLVLAKAMSMMEPLLTKFSSRISEQVVEKLKTKSDKTGTIV